MLAYSRNRYYSWDSQISLHSKGLGTSWIQSIKSLTKDSRPTSKRFGGGKGEEAQQKNLKKRCQTWWTFDIIFFQKVGCECWPDKSNDFLWSCLKISGITLRKKLCTQSSFQWRLKKPATLNLPISVGALAAFCFSFPIFHPDSWKIKTSGRTIADTTETSDSKSFKASKPGIANSLGNPDPHPSCLYQPFVEVPHTSLKCIFDEYRFFNY